MLTPCKTFLGPYIFALYHHEFIHFQNIQDKVPFTLYFDYDKTQLHTFERLFPNPDIIQVFDQFLLNIFLQTPNETDPLRAQLPHQSSIVGRTISHLETVFETTVSI